MLVQSIRFEKSLYDWLDCKREMMRRGLPIISCAEDQDFFIFTQFRLSSTRKYTTVADHKTIGMIYTIIDES